MALTHRPVRRGFQDKRKATFLLPVPLLEAIDEAVSGGAAASKNAFVEAAIDRAIDDKRRADRRSRLEAAMADPLFRRDVEEVERDFRFADAESAREIV
jgi:Arc/MetJ-type ribon-helix-helix transcriptional regulator